MDLASVVPSVAGPKRPQDRIELPKLKESFVGTFSKPVTESGFGKRAEDFGAVSAEVPVASGGNAKIGHGSFLIAAITSCTNTSNPSVMLAAGLLARNARAKGLNTKPWVKTSLAPGSRVVTEYYDRAGLSDDLDQLGFQTVGYGCTTCIGNSGDLDTRARGS